MRLAVTCLIAFAGCASGGGGYYGCPGGAPPCGGACVDLQNDQGNCGACGVTCPAGATCTAGQCIKSVVCGVGAQKCGTSCVSIRSDPKSCGGCGVACGQSQICAAGHCTTPCSPGQVTCSGACTDVSSDPSNCGGCGLACPPGQTCGFGVCSCPNGQIACGPDCIDPMGDPNNCGGCGTICPSANCSNGVCSCQQGQMECPGGCADLQNDPGNCGKCGNNCGGGTCQNGACVCQGGLSPCNGGCVDTMSDPMNCGLCGNACVGNQGCGMGRCVQMGAQSSIKHVVLIVQENHTFDAYFGDYCQAPAFSEPQLTQGPANCEGAPGTDPNGVVATSLDDNQNAAYDPNHTQHCELSELDKGQMDGFTAGFACSSKLNFAMAPDNLVALYQGYAASYALADRYFQPIAGQSWSNGQYFARAQYVFTDNDVAPNAMGRDCSPAYLADPKSSTLYKNPTIADLLLQNGNTFASYAAGYELMKEALFCPINGVQDCTGVGTCHFDPGDIPFEYYSSLVDKPAFMKDFAVLFKDINGGALPDFVFVKGMDYQSEHPGHGTLISKGAAFVKSVVDAILNSPYANDTLILITWDEGGGFFDHVAPPPDSPDDGKPYGTRVPLLAIGSFARQNEVSHVVMEHSSLVKFLEWNFLGATGQLGGRDKSVNNIGSLLDPMATGVAVPEGP